MEKQGFALPYGPKKGHAVSIYNTSFRLSSLPQNIQFFQSSLNHAKENLSSEGLKLQN